MRLAGFRQADIGKAIPIGERSHRRFPNLIVEFFTRNLDCLDGRCCHGNDANEAREIGLLK